MGKKKVSQVEQMRKLTEMSEKELRKQLHYEIATYFFALEHFNKATWNGVKNLFVGLALSIVAAGLSILGIVDSVWVIILSSMVMGYSISLLNVIDYSGGLLKSVKTLMETLYGPEWRK